jgi:hypothetical protein
MRIILSVVLAISGIVGAASPALASKSNATLTASAKSAVQGSTVTLTMTAKKFKTKKWYVQVKKDGAWVSFCEGKPKKGKLKCKGTLPLEGTNSFRAECFWCNNFKTVYSAKATIKGTPAIGSPGNPAAMGTYLALGDDTSKVGDLAVNTVNWNATATYCSNFTNEDVRFEEVTDPCKVSSEFPGYSSSNLAAWEATISIANPVYAGKVVSAAITYLQSKGGSGYVPAIEFRQADGSYLSNIAYHPGSEKPSGFYDEYETTIQGVVVTRTAYFEVAKSISNGHIVANDYSFGRYPTKGLYNEAWLAAN